MKNFKTLEELKEYLHSYGELLTMLEIQEERIEMYKQKMYDTGTAALDPSVRVQVSSNECGKQEVFLITIEGIEEKKREIAHKICETRVDIEEMVACLKNARQQAVMYARYIDQCAWNDIATMLFINKEDYLEKEDFYVTKTFRLHGMALSNIMKNMDKEK